MTSEVKLKTGGDPRSLPDYAALRDEISKLTHPARPDVDWRYVETLCLRLYEHNGVELQTASWYTIARMHTTGLSGLNEGLALIVALTRHHWSVMWPLNTHARLEIITGLFSRLQKTLRAMPPDILPSEIPVHVSETVCGWCLCGIAGCKRGHSGMAVSDTAITGGAATQGAADTTTGCAFSRPDGTAQQSTLTAKSCVRVDNPFRSADNAAGRTTPGIQPATQCAAAAATEGSFPRQSPCSGNGG